MRAITVFAFASFLAACGGSVPPPMELTAARAAYDRAKKGPAAQLDPAGLHNAESALVRAEESFKNEPEGAETKDLAVIAQLKAMAAESTAQTMLAQKKKEQAEKDLRAVQEGRLSAAEARARQKEQEANKTQADLEKTREQLEREKKEAEAERQKRLEAERKLKDAMDTLQKIASVKEDDRGMVVSFQGEALFAPTKATLLPAAMVKLDQVAETLRGQERKINVIGHTDNQGPAQYNQDLSVKRAEAVRDYLVQKGIPADLIRAEGKGFSAPVAPNNTVEGRAANRRVEIIVEPKQQPHK
jgi:outer membrane protein OmpA-like peptidoglycan-associated protein